MVRRNGSHRFVKPSLGAYLMTLSLGWWMSEKLDGVRAYWDGQNFYSRQGNMFKGAPDFFKACVLHL